jgi:protein required for attachment to host cells
MTPNIWILVANQSIAHVYRYEGDGRAPTLVETFKHPEGREHVHRLVSDRAGRAFSHASPLRHSLGTRENPHDHESALFALEVVEYLRNARRRERFSGLALVCEPKFLGLLRAKLDRETARLLVAERAAGSSDGAFALLAPLSRLQERVLLEPARRWTLDRALAEELMGVR